MGNIPVLLISPTCTDTNGMKCVVTAPGALSKHKRTEFLREATKKLQKRMVKGTASQEWKHSKDNTEQFADAMQAARGKVPKAERWKLTTKHSHIEMAHAALATFEVMQGVLPKFGRYPK